MPKARRLLIAFYLVAAAIGAVVPYAVLISGLREQGFTFDGLAGGIWANPAATIFSFDVLLASLVFLALLVVEGRRADMNRLWLYALVLIGFGLSCALPLFLAMRERMLTERA